MPYIALAIDEAGALSANFSVIDFGAARFITAEITCPNIYAGDGVDGFVGAGGVLYLSAGGPINIDIGGANFNWSSTTLALASNMAISFSGTGAATTLNNVLPTQTGNSGKVLGTDGTVASWVAAGTGTVTSVAMSGGTTGLTFTGGPVTTTGTFTAGGTLAPANGGTGINNGSNTLTLNGNLITAGAFQLTLTQTATTNVTLPTTGTIATLAGSEALTNKSLTGSTVTMTGSIGTSAGQLNAGNTAPSRVARLFIKDNGLASNYLAEFHQDDGNPWGGAFFNDTFSTSQAGILFYVMNSGQSWFGSEGGTDIQIGTNSQVTANAHIIFSHSGGNIQMQKPITLQKTITAGGTTGVQTIDKTSGSINLAAADASKVLNNALVSTSSVIIATVATNDNTMKSVQAVAGSGIITFYPNVAPTAETRVNFIVTN